MSKLMVLTNLVLSSLAGLSTINALFASFPHTSNIFIGLGQTITAVAIGLIIVVLSFVSITFLEGVIAGLMDMKEKDLYD